MNERKDPESPDSYSGFESEAPVVLPIEDSLDLHAFRPSEVADLLDDYLREACDRGFREVRIIHGKGTGVLRRKVGAILGKHPLVLRTREAEASGGGWGATIVSLRCENEFRMINTEQP